MRKYFIRVKVCEMKKVILFFCLVLFISLHSFGAKAVLSTVVVSEKPVAPYKEVITDAILSESVTIVEQTPIKNKCAGDCKSILVATVSGGIGSYTYSWTLSSGVVVHTNIAFSTDTVFNVCENTFPLVQVSDAGSGAQVSAEITTATFAPLSSPINTNPTSCFTKCDGSATAIPIGGTPGPSYTYSWSNGSSSQTNTLLCKGPYQITVTDHNGCTITNSATVGSPPAINPHSAVPTNVTCFGLCNGSASVNPSGGVGPFTFVWAPSGGTGATISLRCPNTYTVTITDHQACTISATELITQPPSPLSAKTDSVNVTCNGLCNGIASVVPSGGTAGYAFAWGPSGGTGATAAGLCPATFTVTVTDANACTATSITHIAQPNVLAATPTGTNISCFGFCNGTVNAHPSGGLAPYSFSWSPGGMTGVAAGGLCLSVPSTYTVTVTDANLCTATSTVAVTQPALLAANATKTDVTCNGKCNGTVLASPTGGTAPYTFTWSNGPTTAAQVNLCNLSFTVTVTDANLCTATSNVTITQPLVLTLSNVATNDSCHGVCDGTVVTATAGGTSPFAYSWSNPAGSTSINQSALCTGTYPVTVTDLNGCTATTSATITQPALFTVAAAGTNILCKNACNGTVNATPSGGTLPSTFSWSPGGATGSTVGSLCPNTYTVSVTDSKGCTATSTTVLTQPALLTLSLTPTEVTCFGLNNGSIVSTPGGGTNPYTFAWSNGQTTQNISSLAPGKYTLTLTDNNLCTTTDTLTITQPNVLAGVIGEIPAVCNGGASGQAFITPSGGTPQYSYTWSPAGGTGQTASGLLQGTYSVTLTDANACKFTQFVTVTQPVPITNTMKSTATFCNLCNGTATVTALGGGNGPPFTFGWSAAASGQTSNPATGLCGGVYTVTVSDSKACTETSTIAVNPILSLTVTDSVTFISCFHACNGKIKAVTSGGITPYTFAWNTGPTTQIISGLCAGSYTVTATDADGCSNTSNVTLVDPALLVPAINPPANTSCKGHCDGSALSVPTGGTGAYAFSWSNGTTSATASNLCAGTFTVSVRDANACLQTNTVIITQPAALQVIPTIGNATCHTNDGSISVLPSGGAGVYTFSWSTGATGETVSSLAVGSYTLSLSSGVTCDTVFKFNISNVSGATLAKARTEAKCFGQCNGTATITPTGVIPFSFSWSTGSTAATVNGLCVGIYTVTVQDGSGCFKVDTLGITQPTHISPNPFVKDVSCGGAGDGQITLTPSGGTSPYTFSWSNGKTSASINLLVPNTYTFTVTDANNCDSINNAVITQPAILTSGIFAVNVSCKGSCNGSAVATGFGGTPPHSFTWSTIPPQIDSIASNLCAGPYTVTVTDANSCTSTSNTTIVEPALALKGIIGETDDLCNGGADGTAFIKASGGTPGYKYTWTPAGGTGSTAFGLSIGTYTVTITDKHGCTFTASTTVNQPSALSFTSVNAVNVSCKGAGNGSVNVAVSGGTGIINLVWSNAQTGLTISSLIPGTYTVTATDANACTLTTSAVITEPALLVANTKSINPNCHGIRTDTALGNATGGTGPYAFLWSTGSHAQKIDSVIAGTYVVTVTDKNGCTSSQSVTLIPPVPITIDTTITGANCSKSNGSINVVPSGGNPGYVYSWKPSGASSFLSGLAAGNYSLTVTDTNGCTGNFIIPVNNLNAPSLKSQIITPVKCNGACTGTANIIATGGTPQFTYSWTDVDSIAPTRSGMCAGSYTLVVTDHAGCELNVPVSILQPGAIVFDSSPKNASCSGKCDGSAFVSPTGDTPPYTYIWSNSATGATVNFLCAGNYTLTLTDANSCKDSTNITIGITNVLVAAVKKTNPLCQGLCTGIVSLNMSGGTNPYTFTWSNGAAAATLTSLCAQAYTVSVTDGKGCTITQAILVTEPKVITQTDSITKATCGICNGQISVTVSGGIPAYTYTWGVGGATGQTISGICAGLYVLKVSDSAACTQTFNIPLNNINGPTKSIIDTVPASCFGISDGSATVTGQGGTFPYTYFWLPSGPASNTLSGLPGGLDLIQVTDGNGCIRTDSVIIRSPSQIQPTPAVTQAVCGVSNGQIVLKTSGGAGSYTYSWNPPSGATTATITGLSSGIYNVTITDASSCTQTATIPLNNNNAPVLTISKQDGTCKGSCNGTASVTISGGSGPFAIDWSSGATGLTSVSGLCAGSYTVTVTDKNSCTSFSTVTITEPSLLVLGPAGIAPVSCAQALNGSAEALPFGGTLPYSYSWSNGLTGPKVSKLGLGQITVTVTDSNKCSAVQVITIPVLNAPFTLQSVVNAATCNVCNGQAVVTVNGGTAPFSYLWSSSAATGNTATSLCAGLQSVDVTDSFGCKLSFNLPVSNIGGPVSSGKIISGDSCFGLCNGKASVSPVGGTLPYSYFWLPSGSTSSFVNGLCAGLGFVQITDSNGCKLVDSIPVGSHPVISIIAAVTQPSACKTADGSIILTVSGGSGSGYSYSWNTGSAGATVLGIAAGAYSVTVTDGSGCTQTSVIALNDKVAPVLVMSDSAITCFGKCNGVGIVTASGGAGGYTYSWLAPAVASTDTVRNLCAGTHFVQVNDKIGCITADSVTITEPLQLIFNTPVSTSASCAGVCNGTAFASPAGGTLPFTFNWSNGGTSSALKNLCAGSYTLTVSDGNGCQASQAISITNNSVHFNVSNVVTLATCGVCNGQISVQVSGGAGPLTYLWSNGSSSSTAVGLCAGVQSLTVSDSLGCSSAFQLGLSNSGGATASGKSSTAVQCFGACNGTAQVAPVGGVRPYTYDWLPGGQTTSSVTGLCSGTNFVQIADSNGCILTDTIQIAAPAQILIVPVLTQPSICKVADGSILLFVSGGSGSAYTFAWSNGIAGSLNPVFGLGAGEYVVTVTDGSGCTQRTFIELNDRPAPRLILSDSAVTCPGKCNGVGIVNATGGAGGYLYSWNDPTSATTATVGSLCDSTYFVQVTDISGCMAAGSVTITAPLPLEFSIATVTKVSCVKDSNGSITIVPSGGTLPYFYSWSAFSGTGALASPLKAGPYSVTLTDAKGCTAIQTDSVGAPRPITVMPLSDSASCNTTKDGAVTIQIRGGTGVYTFAWTGPGGFISSGQNLAGVPIGTYTVVVNDGNGCTKQDSVFVAAKTTVIARAGADTSFCLGGSVILNGNLSLFAQSYQWLNFPSLSLISSSQVTSVKPSIGTSDYLLVAVNGICSDSDTVSVHVNPLPVVNAGSAQSVFILQSTLVGGTPTTTSAGASFSWTPGQSLSDSIIANPLATPFITTLYIVTVKDQNGCKGSDSVLITVVPNIIIDNGFTPNNDGKNDTWIIDNSDKFPNCVVEVFNRWGVLLFTSAPGYPVPWNGRYNGQDIPVGTYYYVIQLHDSRFPAPLTGPLTIMR